MGKLDSMYFFYGEVVWSWWEDNVRKTAQEANIILAKSYAHAAGILEENYGVELDHIKRLECISDEGLALPLPIVAGRQFKNAVTNYGKAEIVNETDFSNPGTVRWNPETPFPTDAPVGSVVVVDKTAPTTTFKREDIVESGFHNKESQPCEE